MPSPSRMPNPSSLASRLPTWQDLADDPRAIRHGMNLWPPFRFAGIRVREISPDWRRARVELLRRASNRNFVGTQFGGSMFAMTDPFWMILVMQNLGRDYVVWDKAGEIEFVRPGRTALHAEFVVTEELLEDLRARAADGSKVLHWCETDVVDEGGEVVARVRKQLYVRRKRRD
ncbi:DUF4442 domain-containing protein [Marihabitans asiaticum]